MSFDFERIWKSKRALRERLAALPIAEKLRLLDAMRERAVAIQGKNPRQIIAVQESSSDCGKKP
jgi:hypothetical protein